MIIRAHRFHGYNALRHAYGRGQTVRGPLLAVKYLHNPKRSSYRAAVVVSRKVHKSAVVRGRIRRRIYEVIRGQEAHIAAPYDIIITVFSEQLATMPAAELCEAVIQQLERAGIVSAVGTSSHLRPDGQSRAIVDSKERT
ncbi:MAG TPA: ribonuclease P protein component [Candidatus Saccharimonadales bacterium]|jgi:ribonuclease P protein component